MNFNNKINYLCVISALSLMSGAAHAGGFAIGVQSGSGTGNAFSGGAAVAEDSSVAWYNPAAMTALDSKHQVTVAAHFAIPSFKFTNGTSTGAFAAAGTGEGGDGGDWVLIPNAYYTMSINPKLKFGLSLNAPFGLGTEYDPGWRGRFIGIESALKAININPSLGYKLSDTVSIGAGVSVQKLEAKLSAASAAGIVTIKGDDIGYGYNLGMTVQVTPATRLGLAYRSAIVYGLEGTITVSGAPTANGAVSASVKTPDSASFSLFSAVSPKWEVMGDITWTGWSNIKRLDVVRTTASTGGAAGTTASTLIFNWKDTVRLGVGANYKYSSQTKLRFGLAFDPTPTNDVDRTPRLPDQDRTWATFGVQYQPSKQGIFEFGYAHEFVKNSTVNTTVAGAGTLNGTFKNRADIFTVGYSRAF